MTTSIMLNWLHPIDGWIQKEIDALVQDSTEYEFIYDDSGGFSELYFIEEYACKCTYDWSLGEELCTEGHPFFEDMSLQLVHDAVIIEAVGCHPLMPRLYAKNDDWLVIDKVQGECFVDVARRKGASLSKMEQDELRAFFQRVFDVGYVPYDVNLRNLFRGETLKIIDFNMYQRLSVVQEAGFLLGVVEQKAYIEYLIKEIQEEFTQLQL